MTVRYVIAIDPGKRSGFALFEHGRLTHAAAGPVPVDYILCRGGASIGFSVADVAMRPPSPSREVAVVIERPQPFGIKNEDDLIELALRAGEWSQLLRMSTGAKAEFVKPAKWKGSVPKSVHHKRVLKALSSEERSLLPLRPRAKDYDHNMLDAVGIGLWKLGRMRR